MSRIIDIHTHVWPDALAPVAVATLAEQGGIAAHYDGTVSGLVGRMDEAGIDLAVTQPVATRASQVRTINDWAASTASDRIVPFGSMHPGLEDPVAELHHIASLGLRGFKMHPEYQAFAPDDPALAPLLEAAADLGLIAFFHAGADIGPQTLLGSPAAFARMLDANPTLTVVMAHLGGWQCWDQVLDLIAGRDLWLDTAYTLGHLPDDRFVELVHAHGADRVLFGSDGPWTDPAAEIEHLSRLGFSATELAGILGGNAERLLGIGEGQGQRGQG